MARIFVDGHAVTGSSIALTAEKAHYLSAVLRCRSGDTITVTDSSGNVFTARISAITNKQATLVVGEPGIPIPEPPIGLILMQGLLKGEKMDLVVQKATELGIQQIIPVITERSQLRETRRIARWRKIAEEASRQCGRTAIPVISESLDFTTALLTKPLPETGGIIFWEQDGLPFSSALQQIGGKKQIMLCVGPEGGFSENEIRTAAGAGFVVASLGKRVLRAETAAIAAMAILQYELGDMGAGS